MGSDQKKRQKKLEKRTAKRKEKKHSLIREQNVGLAARLGAAAKYPVLQCCIGDALEDQGIGWVMLAREIPGGQVAAASFLVDRYCLGVKNTFGEILARSDFESKYVRKMGREMPSRSVQPAEARKLLVEAVAYARSLGLAPHEDYSKLMALFGDADPAQSDAKFEFGKDDKPFFIAGPRDTPARCKEVLAILTNSCGHGGFDFLLPMGSGGALVSAPGGENGTILRIEGTEEFDEDEE